MKIILFRQISLGSNLGILALLLQLLSITDEIYNSFDEGLEVRSLSLDISKAFNKVWHKGLLLKLSQNGISGNVLDLLSSFLSDRKQRVLLDGQTSEW